MSEYTIHVLGEIADVVDCEHKTAPIDQTGEFLSVRTTDLKKGRILSSQCNKVALGTYKLWTSRRIPKKGDIILSREAPVGEVGYIDKDNTYCLGQRTVLISPSSKNVEGRYLSYYLQSNRAFEDMSSKSGGSVVSHLNISEIRTLEIPLPPLPEQRAIAEVLSSLDDKIDLLHRNNKTLEEMAEVIYKNLFENCENPVETVIDDCITTKGGTTPSTKFHDFWDGEFAWTSPRDLSNSNCLFMRRTERTLTEKGLKQVSSGLLPIGTVLLSSRAPIGYLAITEIPVAINQGYIACVCDKIFSPWICHQWIKQNMELIISVANGSTFLEIPKSTFRSLPVLLPNSEILADLNNRLEPLYFKIRANENQIFFLSSIRDTLLPKLMSGQVRVQLS